MDRLEERHLYEWGNIHCQILISRGTPPWTMKNCQNWSSESRMVLDHVCCPRPKEAEIDLQGLWTPSMFCLATSINAYAMDTHTHIYISHWNPYYIPLHFCSVSALCIVGPGIRQILRLLIFFVVANHSMLRCYTSIFGTWEVNNRY